MFGVVWFALIVGLLFYYRGLGLWRVADSVFDAWGWGLVLSWFGVGVDRLLFVC